MRLKPVALGLWIAVFVLGGVWVADRTVAPPAPPVAGALPGAPPVDADAVAGPAAASPAGGPVATLVPFTLPDLAGTPRASREWDGSTVLYNFWATWCAPCRREMPLLDRLHQGFAGPPGARVDRPALVVVGIAIDRVEPVLRFVGETGITYPVLVGQMDATAVGERFGIDLVGLPYSAVVAPGGAVLAVLLGELKDEDLALIADVARLIDTEQLDTEAARSRLATLPRARVPGPPAAAPAPATAPDPG
jgi:thiol-disulfide isomerase/thioredoxin